MGSDVFGTVLAGFKIPDQEVQVLVNQLIHTHDFPKSYDVVKNGTFLISDLTHHIIVKGAFGLVLEVLHSIYLLFVNH